MQPNTNKIYRLLGKRGNTTIPYALRIQMGIGPEDLVSFQRKGNRIVVELEKSNGNYDFDPYDYDFEEDEPDYDALFAFLDSLPENCRDKVLNNMFGNSLFIDED